VSGIALIGAEIARDCGIEERKIRDGSRETTHLIQFVRR